MQAREVRLENERSLPARPLHGEGYRAGFFVLLLHIRRL